MVQGSSRSIAVWCCTFSEHWHTVQQIQHGTREETPEIPLQRAPFTTACKLLFLLGSSNREKCFSRKYYPHFYYTFLTKTFCSALTPSHPPPFFFPHSVEVNKKQIKQEMRNENQVLLTIQQLKWKVLGFRCGIFLFFKWRRDEEACQLPRTWLEEICEELEALMLWAVPCGRPLYLYRVPFKG